MVTCDGTFGMLLHCVYSRIQCVYALLCVGKKYCIIMGLWCYRHKQTALKAMKFLFTFSTLERPPGGSGEHGKFENVPIFWGTEQVAPEHVPGNWRKCSQLSNLAIVPSNLRKFHTYLYRYIQTLYIYRSRYIHLQINLYIYIHICKQIQTHPHTASRLQIYRSLFSYACTYVTGIYPEKKSYMFPGNHENVPNFWGTEWFVPDHVPGNSRKCSQFFGNLPPPL